MIVGLRARWAAVCAAVAVCAVAFGAGLSALADVSDARFVAAVLIVAATTVAVVYDGHRRKDLFGPLQLASFYYICTFVFGAIYFKTSDGALVRYRFNQITLADAVLIAATGFALLTAGYYSRVFDGIARWIPRPSTSGEAAGTGPLVVALLAIGWSARAISFVQGTYFHVDSEDAVPTAQGSAGWVLYALTLVPAVAMALVGASYYLGQTRNPGRTRLLFWGLAAIELVYAIPTGSRAAVLTVFLSVAVLRYYGRGAVAPKLRFFLPLAAACVFGLFPFSYELRNDPVGYQSDLGGATERTVDRMGERTTGETLEAGMDATFSRFSASTSLAAVIDVGREHFSRSPGETLKWIPEVFLPRALVPNKTDIGPIGNEFARDFALIPPNDTETAIAIGQVTELYINFGLLGVLFGMPIVGAILAAVGAFFHDKDQNAVILAVYAVTSWSMINGMEGIIAGGIVGLFKTMLVLLYTVVVVGAVVNWLTARPQWRARFA